MSDVRKILVVDDEQVVQDLFCEIVRMLGHEALACAHGDDALKLYQESHEAGKTVDLVILDLNISHGMGGLETMEKLRGMNPGVKAVVTSGNPDDPVMRDFAAHGFRAVVHKPYRVSQVSKLIQEILFNP